MNNGNDNLKIKTVSGRTDDEELTFSPEEMHPIEVAEALESNLIGGKTLKQVKRARRLFGANEMKNEFRLSFKESLKNQVKGLSSVFLIASSLSMYIFKPDETTYLVMALIIAAIVFLNAFAEFRTGIALKLPKKYSSLKTRVVRNDAESIVDSRLLVPGDVITLEQGAIVPADCRLIDDFDLSVLETHVSGVEGSVMKNSRYLARDGAEVICANMIYAGSIITSGHCNAIVCRTGKETLMRRMRDSESDSTPDILKYVVSLCRTLSVASVIVSFSLLFLGIAAGVDVTHWFVCSLAIGASSLCDSMVSLCAASLGFGANRMAQDGMVIKNYNAIRTLAKTDTIMCGKNLAFPPKRISLTGLYFSGKPYDREKRPTESVEEFLKLMLVCSDVRKVTPAEKKQKRGMPDYIGNPLDNAIVDYFEEWTKTIGNIHDEYIRIDAEYTLSGEVSRLLALRNGKNIVIVRGSPENILSRCVGYTLDGTDYKISDFTRKKILSAAEDYARTNNFLLAVAVGETTAESLRDIESEQRLIFKGFVSFSSSLDPGVAEAVYRCGLADIETVLNSNDAYYTALNSAKSAGIITDEAQIITSEQIRDCDRGLFIANSPYYKLFLNVDDNEWLDIVGLRRQNKRVTAVTAERINELPIMREADVSIVPEDSCDTLRQTADALMLGKGINLIADGILNAKTICRRIGSVVKYLPAGVLMMLVASVFSACYNQTPPMRAQDVLFGGIVFNLIFAIALAFEPLSVKNMRNVFPFERSTPTLNDFMFPLMYGVGGGIVLFICSAATQDYTCAMLSLTLMLFIYAGSVGDHGGLFASRRFGNRLLLLCGLGVAFIVLLLLTAPFCKAWFGYTIPTTPRLVISLVLSVGYSLAAQILRFILTNPQKARTEDEQEETQPSADPDTESDGNPDGDENEDEFFLEDDPEDDQDENENKNNSNERSSDDEDYC